VLSLYIFNNIYLIVFAFIFILFNHLSSRDRLLDRRDLFDENRNFLFLADSLSNQTKKFDIHSGKHINIIIYLRLYYIYVPIWLLNARQIKTFPIYSLLMIILCTYKGTYLYTRTDLTKCFTGLWDYIR